MNDTRRGFFRSLFAAAAVPAALRATLVDKADQGLVGFIPRPADAPLLLSLENVLAMELWVERHWLSMDFKAEGPSIEGLTLYHLNLQMKGVSEELQDALLRNAEIGIGFQFGDFSIMVPRFRVKKSAIVGTGIDRAKRAEFAVCYVEGFMPAPTWEQRIRL